MESLTEEQIAKLVDAVLTTDRAQEVDITPLDAEVEMAWFKLEGIANEFYVGKGMPIRFQFRQETPDMMEVRHREFTVAIYIRSLRKLYRMNGSLQIHWMMISRAISNVYPDTKLIGE